MTPTHDPVLCHCLGVTEMEVRGAVSTGAIQTLRDVIHCTGAGAGCTACHRRIAAVLAAQCGAEVMREPAGSTSRSQRSRVAGAARPGLALEA